MSGNYDHQGGGLILNFHFDYLHISLRGGGVRRLMEKSILNFHFDSWNPSLNMMISSVHLNQRFWKNLSCLRALVSQRRKSHKGWQRRFIDIYVDIYMLFRILLLYDGQYQEMVHTKFSVLSMWLRFSITDHFPLSIHSWGLSENTLVLVPPTNLSDMFNSNCSGQSIVDTSVTRYSGWPMSSWRNIFSPSGSKVLLRDLREAWKP